MFRKDNADVTVRIHLSASVIYAVSTPSLEVPSKNTMGYVVLVYSQNRNYSSQTITSDVSFEESAEVFRVEDFFIVCTSSPYEITDNRPSIPVHDIYPV